MAESIMFSSLGDDELNSIFLWLHGGDILKILNFSKSINKKIKHSSSVNMIIEYAQEERRFKNTIQYNEKQRRNNNSENLLGFVPNFTDKEFWIYFFRVFMGAVRSNTLQKS